MESQINHLADLFWSAFKKGRIQMLLSILLTFVATEPLELHSFSSKIAKAVVLECKVVDSNASLTEGNVMLAVTKVGLGNPKLVGSTLQAKYQIAHAGTHTLKCYTSANAIAKGETMVVVVSHTREVYWIDSAWREDALMRLEAGISWLAELEPINKATTVDQLAEVLTEKLKRQSKSWDHTRRLFWSHIARQESLLKHLVESNDYADELRKVAKHNYLSLTIPDWRSSPERRDELLNEIDLTKDQRILSLVVHDFVTAFRQLKPAKAAPWKERFCQYMLTAEERMEEEMRAIVLGVKHGVETEFWAQTGNDSKLILWGALFEIAANAKKPHIRKAWEDILVEGTQQGALFIKEDVLARLEDIKDPTFRDRLRDAAYTPSERFGVAPPKP